MMGNLSSLFFFFLQVQQLSSFPMPKTKIMFTQTFLYFEGSLNLGSECNKSVFSVVATMVP